ncbi:MAG: hypothetical protein CFH15_01422 [Alphaproteobacteria bacterium MarineAlpha5_Bin5]|nr:MAG: hypothetical protein CFH15_01422 [Alphaproteobacteria bacterium MarineAlpha5_Bin5]PPR50008.1 MAG: hypothetical protein CFH14_00947 [Alphaproteobacteria bacterium MarineAlpha5_Bin4]|tara:strand:- start:781 stop:1260 length:480 start_codon:yes stop_codon:yes gene_type:complete
MSLINLKSKKEPQYFNNISETVKNNSFIDKEETITEKNPINTSSSLLIGEGVNITGTIKAENEVTIQGSVDGDVDCHTVIVSKTGSMKGKLKAEIMKVEGKFEGEMNINDQLHIRTKGSVNGKVFYGSIQIDDGGKLLGEINYRGKNNKQEEFKDWKAL